MLCELVLVLSIRLLSISQEFCVQVFILHLQLKSYILTGDLLEYPLPNTTQITAADSGGTHASDVSSASFGSEVSLGCYSSKSSSIVQLKIMFLYHFDFIAHL